MDNHINARLGSPRKRETYHHGDLRRDLLRVAWGQIATHGAAGLSLASLARQAGVAQSAPYRHFADRRALLEAVATEGFELLSQTMRDAAARPSRKRMTHVLAEAYVRFGEANVEVYRLMFASRLTSDARDGSDLDAAAAKALTLLHEAVSVESGGASEAQTKRMVYLAWAKVHGLVMLKADGFIVSEIAEYIDADP